MTALMILAKLVVLELVLFLASLGAIRFLVGDWRDRREQDTRLEDVGLVDSEAAWTGDDDAWLARYRIDLTRDADEREAL